MQKVLTHTIERKGWIIVSLIMKMSVRVDCNDIDNCHGDCDKVHCGGGMNNCVDGIDVGGVAPEYCRLYPSCRARAAYLLVALGGQRRYTVSECRRSTQHLVGDVL